MPVCLHEAKPRALHTLLKLFQGESSKQDSVKFEGVVERKRESPSQERNQRKKERGTKRERECGKLDKRELQWSTIYCDPPTPQISGETLKNYLR